jgi:cysteinyl-tRNA synthetase
MTLHVYDHLARDKRRFEPVRPGRVGLYVCGMTVQDRPHVGHMFTFVACDMVRRYLEHLGYEVTHVQNFTDIDDKIIARAREEGVAPAEVAERNIAAFLAASDRLGIRRAHAYPRVTEHIDEIVAYVQKLVEQGHAYAAGGDVYFDVRSWPEYGTLSGRHVDDMRAGVRIEVGQNKRDPLDFALWKRSAEGEPGWDAPWGRGRPGWHIECSVLATRYLGEHFDFHGGGRDLLFPHHENERAQACACSGRPYVNYWLHTGLLLLDDRKMSKSDGNFFLIEDVLDSFPPEVVRFFLLNAHFRSQIAYDEERLQEAAAAHARLRRGVVDLLRACRQAATVPDDDGPPVRMQPVPQGLISAAGEILLRSVREHERDLFGALDDDFNSGGAIGVLFSLLRDVHQYLSVTGGAYLDLRPLEAARDLCAVADGILGLFPGGLERLGEEKVPTEVSELAAERDEARRARDWPRADQLREMIRARGFEVTDTPDGPRLARRRS